MIAGIIARAHTARVPVAIHWDHGATYEQMLQAFQFGFTSVMLDASTKPFDENVAISKKVTDSAHSLGVSVEGELGTIGGNDSYAEAGAAEIIYTDPDDAVTFVEQTGVDSLAIAIGTFHGFYPAHLKPELKLDLLKEIKSRVQIPLVLHGGSGNPDDEIREAARIGINKINISTDTGADPAGAARRLRQPGRRDPRGRPHRHQQNQHLDRHQGRLPQQDARGAGQRPQGARAERHPAGLHRGHLALTKRVTDSAHVLGVSVEGELGTIGGNDSYAEAGAAEIIYTDPDDEIREAARIGINKINISTDIKVAYHGKMREVLGDDPKVREPNAIQPACIRAMQVVAAQKIELFGAAGKGSLY